MFYGINKAFVDRMINEGERPILDKEDLNNYMQLAEDFGEYKLKSYSIANVRSKENGGSHGQF